MKECTICRVNKPVTDYYSNRGKPDNLSNMCKPCARAYMKEYYKKTPKLKRIRSEAERKLFAETKKFIDTVKASGGCIYCGESEPCCLDFHHKDSKEKEYEISQLVHRKSLTKLKIEMEKCDIVCANCHRKLHRGIQLTPVQDILRKLSYDISHTEERK
jgi:hypothetical protein